MVNIKIRTTTKQKVCLILISILLTLIILEFGLRFTGFIILQLEKKNNKVKDNTENIYRILALGESTTQGGRNS